MALDNDDPVEVYRREIATVSPLTREEEAHLFKEARLSGVRAEAAKRRLIERHLHLVLPVAERHASDRLSMLELIQEGNLGLMRALEKFPETPARRLSGLCHFLHRGIHLRRHSEIEITLGRIGSR